MFQLYGSVMASLTTGGGGGGGGGGGDTGLGGDGNIGGTVNKSLNIKRQIQMMLQIKSHIYETHKRSYAKYRHIVYSLVIVGRRCTW